MAELLDTEKIEVVAHILKTVAHPLRIGIVDLLNKNEELTVGEICQTLDSEQSLTSHHLQNMKLKGILASRRSGKHIFYSLKIKEVVSVIECIENCNHIPL
ncbi:MAG: winged helix-turn-helix transcriptional regulator [Cyclobacteriaceae bacterium]|nr:winged helix-turn-helix transcriptional regulator [Cyclobacteriaceae bacterium HetDA_MAG_MS6]